MKIKPTHIQHVHDIAKDYRDVFEQYNDDIDKLLGDSLSILIVAKSAQIEASNAGGKLSKMRSEINADIAKKERYIADLTSNEKKAKQDLIAQERSRILDQSFVHSASEIATLSADIDHAKDRSENAETGVTMDELTAQYTAMSEIDMKKTKTIEGIIANIGHSYGMYKRKDNKMTNEFSNLYREVKQEIESSGEDLSLLADPQQDDQYLFEEFKDKYRFNPYQLLRYMTYLLCFPYAICCSMCINPSAYKGIGGGIRKFKDWLTAGFHAQGAVKLKVVGSTAAYVLYLLILLLGPTGLFVLVAIASAALFVCYKWSSNNIYEYIRKTIKLYMYYDSISGHETELANAERERLTAEVRKKYRAEFEALTAKLEAWNNENIAARKQAEKDFDPSSIDTAKMDKQYKESIARAHIEIDDMRSKLGEIQKEFNKLDDKKRKADADYIAAKEKVHGLFADGMSFDTTNGITNDIALAGESNQKRNFIYHIAYSNVYTLLNGLHIFNPFGQNVNSGNIGMPIQSKNDVFDDELIVRTIPAKLVGVDIQKYAMAANENVNSEVINDLITIISNAGKEFVEFVKGQKNNKLDEFQAEDNIDRFDLMGIYKLAIDRYDSKSTLIFYNSLSETNPVQTISKFIYERLFSATYSINPKRSARFHFIATDPTFFNNMDIYRIMKSNGAAEQVLRDLKANNIYDIVKLENLSAFLKDILDVKIPKYTDAIDSLNANIDSKISSNVEYNIAARAKGSSTLAMDYVFLWIDPKQLDNDSVLSILRRTGGSASGGEETSIPNGTGIVPFVFVDLAYLKSEKPDNELSKSILDIVKAVSYNNIFAFNRDGETPLRSMTRRDAVRLLQNSIDSNK